MDGAGVVGRHPRKMEMALLAIASQASYGMEEVLFESFSTVVTSCLFADLV